ncbi:MAG: N-acetylmuramoyl-L-alanine amidase [Clostridia bacterium]|nr:N-acetylmuramoyl-L-alanine amidase [Clostridia bacterium]
MKKGLLAVIAVIIAVGATLGIVCGTGALTASSAGEKVIVIDAGHGGIDAGVLGINTSTKESDINLAIAKQLQGYFSDAGFTAVLTRKNNAGLYGLSTKGFKMRDMKKRKEIIEQYKADMVISVHQNFCPLPSRRGGQVFYEKTSECGKALAECIQSAFNNMEECVKKNTPLVGDYYMLKCTENPSVIVECGFLSNAEDEALLISTEYQKKLAYAIFKGAVSYYS